MGREPADIEADRDEHLAAIRQVIRAETLAYCDEDFDAWAACFVQDARTHDVLVSSVAGLSVQEGWPAVARHMKGVFRDRLTTRIVEFGQENMRIDISGDMAWAVFDSWSRTTEGVHLRAFDIRILRRLRGRWKIVFNSFIQREIDGSGGAHVCLDARGRVIWESPDATEALQSHPILVLRAGRLRARRPDWDRVLQAALREAARHHGFFETHMAAETLGGPARYPVILGRTDTGGVAILDITIRDCVTYLRVDGSGDLDRRLRLARTAFALSDGQLRVARRIAAGHGLKEIARDLGVSVTTARTHLNRIYEKTGVRAQVDLVRLLLSVG